MQIKGSIRTHPFAPDARGRPGETPVRTAVSPRYLIRPPWPAAATRDENRVCPAKLGSRCSRARWYGRFSFQDEAAGSSPARPTTPGLTCGNAYPVVSFNRGCSHQSPAHSGPRTHPCLGGLPGGCTVALQRIPVRIQAVRGSAVLNHSCAVSLTSGVPRHSLPCGSCASDRRILGGLSGHLRLSLR
jgi:hypothetical protein